MRPTFVRVLTQLAAEDPNVFLLTGDLGYSVFEDFMTRFPRQYLNVGVAEQNLVGVAAGLALAGKKVFVYSIATFATMRCYEQIRNDVAYQNLPVFVIGSGSTFSYSTFGCTHFPLEDLGIMRILPNMLVTSPGDPHEVEAITRQMYTRGGPAYMRIAKRGEPVVHATDVPVTIGRAIEVRKGDRATIMSTGRQLPNAIAAADALAAEGIQCRVLSMHTWKPLDTEAVLAAARETSGIVTVEEHLAHGGFGSAVLEALADAGVSPTAFTRLAIPDEFPKGVGMQDHFLERYRLTIDGIADAVKSIR